MRIATFLQHPEQGEVSRRTTFIRYNGLLDGLPSFTVISNRCVHLGCPVQPNGPLEDEDAQEEEIGEQTMTRIPAQPAGFGCPCHGGQYDNEGNRTAGPPVRALDRFEFAIRDGRLFFTTPSASAGRGRGRRTRSSRSTARCRRASTSTASSSSSTRSSRRA